MDRSTFTFTDDEEQVADPIETFPLMTPASPVSKVNVRAPAVPLDVAVQMFSAYGGSTLDADDFAGVVLRLSQTPANALSTPTTIDDLILPRRLPDLGELNEVAQNLRVQGKFKEAEALLTQALTTLKSRLGVDDAMTLRASNSLACLLQHQGRFLEARRLYLSTVESQRRHLGVDHLDTVATLENLATLLYEQDDLDSAEPLLREAVMVRRRVLGDDHSDTLRSFNNMALLLQKRANYVEAESMLREALAGQRRVLGMAHIETLTTLSNLAILLEDRGNIADAEALHQQCFNLRRQSLGRAHADTLASANNLAAFLMAQKRHIEALPILTDARALATFAFPASHFFVGNLEARLGTCLVTLGRYKEAEKPLVDGFSKLKATLGLIHHRTQRALSSLISLYEGWGKPDKAAPFRVQAAACS